VILQYIQPPAHINAYDSALSTMWFDEDGVFRSITKKDQTVDVNAMKVTFEYIDAHKKSEKICWIGDVTNASPVEKEARAYMRPKKRRNSFVHLR